MDGIESSLAEKCHIRASAMDYYTGLPKVNSSDIHDSEITLQHPGSTVNSSSCPSNREGFGDSLGGSGLSFLIFLHVSASPVSIRTGLASRPTPANSVTFP